MKAKATIRLKLSSTRELETVKASLLPEVTKPGFSRAHVSLASEDTFLVLTVKAEDTVALRSTLNAYLRWIRSLMKIFETLDCLS
jgi:tRNA threonylcarbamoyladenosine modification (KEOPS) complex  Pcc1 subunit